MHFKNVKSDNVGNSIPIYYSDVEFDIIFTVVQFSVELTNGFTLRVGTITRDKDGPRDITKSGELFCQ